MTLTRIEDPEIALLAFAESKGNASAAAKRISDGRYFISRVIPHRRSAADSKNFLSSQHDGELAQHFTQNVTSKAFVSRNPTKLFYSLVVEQNTPVNYRANR